MPLLPSTELSTLASQKHVNDLIEPTGVSTANRKIPLGLYPVVEEYYKAVSDGYETMIRFIPSVSATEETIRQIRDLVNILNEGNTPLNIKKLPPDVYEIVYGYEKLILINKKPKAGTAHEEEYLALFSSFQKVLGKTVSSSFGLPHLDENTFRDKNLRTKTILSTVELLPQKWNKKVHTKKITRAAVLGGVVLSPSAITETVLYTNFPFPASGGLALVSALMLALTGGFGCFLFCLVTGFPYRDPVDKYGLMPGKKFLNKSLAKFAEDYDRLSRPSKETIMAYLLQESPHTIVFEENRRKG